MNIVSPINQLGYGITGLNICKNLSEYSKICLWVIGQPQVTNQEDANIISQLVKNAQFFDNKAPCLKIWHQHDMAQFAGSGPRIGFPIFELDEFNPVEKHQLSTLDKIFVCSNWAKDVVLANININSENVYITPLGVDSSIFKPEENKNESTIFFNCGKWEIRKGHDIIPELFSDAFNVDDNVELWMMNSNPFLSKEDHENWQNLYKNTKMGYKIRFIDRAFSQNEVYNIMKLTDCGLFPSRAEGWNLELLEMMSCGKSVITTNYSAHKQFCNEENSYLVEIENKELAYDGQWFHGKIGSWAKIDQNQKDQFIQYMREVHNKKQKNELIPNYFGIQTAEKFSWRNSAKNILEKAYV
jgi:glycosyltransferase involved in cell wall biosynthesis